MANRRMFSLDVINTDNFLDMPVSAQCLYFHLGMRADDDGFVSAPKQIIRMVVCSQDDIKILISKGFVIPFESGVVVIRHWKQHNYIQSDRYRKTKYVEEYARLELKENVYILDTEINQDGHEMLPQVRVRDRVRDRVRKDIESTADHEKAQMSVEMSEQNILEIEKNRNKKGINYQQIADMYNATCVSFPKVTKLSDARKKAIKARMKVYSVEDFQRLFDMAESSKFLKGQNDRNWSATFDWLINDRNMAKVLDGNYANIGSRQQPVKKNSFTNIEQRNYNYSALESQLLSD